MRKTNKFVAAVVAAVITATSSAAMLTNADDSTAVAPAITSIGSDTQVEALRYMLNEYISKNNIEAWLYDKEDTPEGLIIIGYYFEDEDIPVKIVSYIKDKGYDPLLVKFIQEKYKQGEKTKNLDDSNIYIPFLNGEYWQMNEGETSLARVFGYEDSKEYKDGESPLTFKIADENIAVIKNINGPRVELYAKSKGETTLTVTAPDGRTTTARVVVDGALPTTTTTVRTNDTETSTTTVKIDYKVQVEYDESPMKTGEKREVKFYNPNTKTAKNGKVNTSSECISIDYEEGKDTFTVTALKEGKAEIYITAEGCTFGSYVYLDIISSEAVKGDTNCDGQLDMADAVLIMQALANPNKYGLGGTAERHLTEQGKINGDMDGDGLTVGDAQAIQEILLGLK